MLSDTRLGGRTPPRDLPLWRTTDRHPPTRPEGAWESVCSLSGPFALATGVVGTAGGSGKGAVMVAVLVLPVHSLSVCLAV